MKRILILLCLPFIGFGQTIIPDPNFEQKLINLGYDTGTPNGFVPTANIDTITTLVIVNGGISDLTGIQDFISLDYLNCYNNQLTYLDVSYNIALDSLNCSHNQLDSLNISGIISLSRLDCYDNQLEILDVTTNASLNYLRCGANNLTTLDLDSNPALTILRCDGNSLNTLNLSNNPALNELDFSANQLTSLNISNHPNLTKLDGFSNNLTSLNVNGVTSLTYLSCAANNLSILDVSTNTLLTHLACHYNDLATLDLRNGNNINMGNADFVSAFNPNLLCIDVDDPVYSTANWSNIDPWSNFSANCNPIFGCTDSLSCNYDSLATADDGTCVYPVIWQQGLSICDGDSILVGSSFYDTAGVFTDTLTAGNGCDSILYTTIVVDPNTSSYDTLSVTNVALWWNAMLLDVSGDYSDTLTNANGCDSIANLNLTVTTTGISDIANNKSNLVKITDMLGQETPYKRNTPLFYIYDDGTVEKRITIE